MKPVYLPVPIQREAHYLSHGRPLPYVAEGEKSFIVAMGRFENAHAFANALYGSDFTVLEARPETAGIDLGGGQVALTDWIPPERLSRLTLLKALRRTDPEDSLFFRGPVPFGEDTECRAYVDFHGRGFLALRHMAVEDAPYSLHGPFVRGGRDDPAKVSIDGADLFGQGLDWKSFETLADAHVVDDIARLRHLPVVKFLPVDEPYNSETLLSGLCGATVEIFHVSEERIDSWGGDVKGEGWHWSRQDKYGIHGPFNDSEAAYDAAIASFSPDAPDPLEAPTTEKAVKP